MQMLVEKGINFRTFRLDTDRCVCFGVWMEKTDGVGGVWDKSNVIDD